MYKVAIYTYVGLYGSGLFNFIEVIWTFNDLLLYLLCKVVLFHPDLVLHTFKSLHLYENVF